VDLSNGQFYPVGASTQHPDWPVPGANYGAIPFAAAAMTCLGGSGRNVAVTSSVTDPALPVGLYRPTAPGEWVCLQFPDATVSWYADGTTELFDGTGIVASIGTDGSLTGPAGTLAATSYGRDTYNSGGAFNVTLTPESGGTIRPANVVVSAGTVQAGVYAADDAANYTSVDDAGFAIAINPDGTGELYDATAAIAIRAAGSLWDPSGAYVPTTYGKDTYNAGDDFDCWVVLEAAIPTDGTIYLEVVENSDGSISSVAGPLFAATMPSSSGAVYRVPLASIASGVPRQHATGPIAWRANFAGSSHTHPEYDLARALTIAGL